MRLIAHVCRCVTTVVTGLCGVLLLVAVVALWHVSRGPVSVSFLAPYLQQSLNQQDVPVGIDLADSRLTWEGWGRTLDVAAEEVRVVGPDGSVSAVLPRLSVSLSIRSLLTGEVAPSSITVVEPAIRLVRDEKGDISVAGAGSGSGTEGGRILESVIRSDRQGGALRYLSTVRVESATVHIDDRLLHREWHFPRADVELRREIDRLSLNGSVTLRHAGVDTELVVNGRYHPSTGGMDIAASFVDLVPAKVSTVLPDGIGLAELELPVSGTVRWEGDGDGPLSGALSFDLAGAEGTVALPVAPEERLKVAFVELRGRLMDFSDLLIDQFYLDAHGPRVSATGLFFDITQGGELHLDVSFENLSFDGLAERWPSYLVPKVRRWVTGRLSDGAIDSGQITLAARAGPGGPLDLKLTDVGGWMEASGTTVDYLPPMPKVSNAKARATFGPTHFDIRVEGGNTGPIRVESGTILLSDLDKKHEKADIDLVLEGPIEAALSLIDQEPLRLTRRIELPYDDIRGTTQTRLSLKFPFTDGLQLDDVTVVSSSTLTDVRIPNGLFDIDVEQGDLTLDVDKQRMLLAGRIRWLGLPAWMQWERPFEKEGPLQSRYDLDIRVDHHHLTRLGIDPRPYVIGELPVKLKIIQYRDDRTTVEGNVDLTRATVNVNAFDWTKQPDVPGRIAFDLRFAGDHPTEIRSFTVDAGDLAAQGSVAFVPEERRVEKIQLSNFLLGATELTGVLYIREDGGLDADVSGPSLDAMRLFRKPQARSLALPRITLSGSFDKVWIQPAKAISNVSGAAFHDGDLWRSIVIRGGVGEGGTMELRLGPDGDRRDIVITSNDAGAALRTFGLYDDMNGGTMNIKGVFNDAHPKHPLVGVADVRDFRIRNAPAMAKLLSIASLTGILESLSGDGLVFSQLNAPFALVDGQLELKSARAYGPSLGITLKGVLDLQQDALDMEGTIVPAYAINSLLGNLPLVGGLVTGGDRGSGLFAATYSMRGPRNAPDITINPLAALAPGFLRKLFDIFEPPPAQSSDNGPAVGRLN
ncbi:MAG: AsmA-like C-terminal region-containing protein [Acetobacterales bacterium]